MMHMDSLTSQWFAVQVWSGREQLCATHLRHRGYEIFLPCYTEYRRWSDRVKKCERALFGGYLFCRIPEDVVGNLISAPGVVRLVGDGHRPLPVASDEITALQRIVDAGLTAEPWAFLRAGQRVHITYGPLEGMEGIVVTVKNRDRLVVSVSLLRRSVAVELDSSWISVAPELVISGRGAN